MNWNEDENKDKVEGDAPVAEGDAAVEGDAAEGDKPKEEGDMPEGGEGAM